VSRKLTKSLAIIPNPLAANRIPRVVVSDLGQAAGGRRVETAFGRLRFARARRLPLRSLRRLKGIVLRLAPVDIVLPTLRAAAEISPWCI
jgi:hypothetical protein